MLARSLHNAGDVVLESGSERSVRRELIEVWILLSIPTGQASTRMLRIDSHPRIVSMEIGKNTERSWRRTRGVSPDGVSVAIGKRIQRSFIAEDQGGMLVDCDVS